MQENPMLHILNQSRLSTNNNIVSMIKNSPNPQVLLNNLLAQNPKVSGLINQYGGDARTAFYALAQQKGVDPNSILDMLK